MVFLFFVPVLLMHDMNKMGLFVLIVRAVVALYSNERGGDLWDSNQVQSE